MNAFRTISRVLVVTAVVAVSAASASQVDEKVKKYVAQLVAPVAVKELLKDQNPYISPVAEAAVATWLNGHLPTQDRKKGQEAGEYYGETVRYFGANAASRELAVLVAANTRLNKKNFEDACDTYVGEKVPYVGKPASKIIKKIAPSVVESAHNSIALSVKEGKPAFEFSFVIG
jgi:hypothetical protein